MMNRVRVIPVLLLDDVGLYKTKLFSKPIYIGDPINAVRIFNEKEVDELILIDFTARENKRSINFRYIEDIVSEAFMPICYGGNVDTIEQCEKLFQIGVEKICLNYAAVHNPNIITSISNRYGSQSVVISVDVKRNILGQPIIYTARGKEKIKIEISEYAKKLEDYGAGELIITAINREGTRKGYDIEIIRQFSEAVNIPVIANGGAKDLNDMFLAVSEGKASAVAAGTMFVYWGKLQGILLNYPDQAALHNFIFNKLK